MSDIGNCVIGTIQCCSFHEANATIAVVKYCEYRFYSNCVGKSK